MRRFTGLFALIAILLSLASVQAQQTYSQPVTFSTSNQSMWSPSLGTAGYSYDLPLTRSWFLIDGSSSYRHVPILGRFGGGASIISFGKAGLDFNAYATSGSVDVSYPLTLTLTYPDSGTLSPGQTFTVSSAWVPTGGTLNTHSPDAGVSLNAILQSNPLDIYVKAVAFSHNVISDEVVNIPLDINKRLFDSHTLTQGSTDIVPGILSVAYHLPVVTTKGGPSAGGTAISTSGQDDFLTITGDISNALAKLLDLPPFAGGFSKGYKYANCFVNYAFLDLQAQIPIALAQNFQFTPQPTVTLNLSSGSPVTFQAGQSVQLTMPADGSPLTVTPSVGLNNQFTNRTHVKVGGQLNFTLLDVEAGAHVSGLFTKTFNWQPLPTLTLLGGLFGFGGTILDVNVYNQTFQLGGFSSQSLPAFTVTPVDNTPLVANDDYYNATTTDGVNYTLDVPAPGILANDTGPSGFHADDFVGTTADGIFAITIDTNGHFNFQNVQSVQGAAGQYVIPYTIRDNQGDSTTANIYVTIGGGG
jgi:hypothetical protein